MYCKNCGKLLNDDDKYCSSCGTKTEDSTKSCHNCGIAVIAGETICSNCGVIIEDNNSYDGNTINYNGKFQEQNNQQYNQSYTTGEIQNGQEQKSKIVAGILGILVGGLGIHRFYLGYIGIGILQLILSIITFGAAGIWGFIEGILILCGSGITTDSKGVPLSDK